MTFARRSGDRQTGRGGLKTLASHAILTDEGRSGASGKKIVYPVFNRA
jgi:hypothetical protein